MKTKFLVKTGLLGSLLMAGTLSFAQTLDRIIVVVNDDVVTEQELAARTALIKRQYAANPQVLPSPAILEKQLLDALILESLQLQLAERGNLRLPEQQIDQTMARLAQNQNMTLEQFVNALENSGTSVDLFREQVRREATISEVQKQIVGRKIFVSDAEVDRYLSSQSGQSLQDTEYQLSYLRFAPEQQTEAEALIDSINAGTTTLLDAGGRDLGMRKLADVPSLLRTLVPVLGLNEAVLIAKEDALHVAQLINKSEQKEVNVQEHRIRHILISTDALLDDASALALITDLKQQIENGASMATLADEYTNDTGTRGRGGDLDWTSVDSFVPEFKAAALNTPVNEVSDIIKTQFGYHILRVEGVRTRDVGIDVLRKQIRNQLTQRRYEESLQRWLTELRAESYVEFRQ